MSDSGLYDRAAEVLALAEGWLIDPPSRSYVDAGSTPAFDSTDQLTVHIATIQNAGNNTEASSLGDGKSQRMAGPMRAPFVITLIRCATMPTSGGVPTVAALQAVALGVHTDVWRMLNGLRADLAGGALAGMVDPFVSDPLPVDEQGGAVGWTITVTAGIDGYVPDVAGP